MKKKSIYKNNNVGLLPNIIISKQQNKEMLFEIKNHVTTDLAEAVSIMMRTKEVDDFIWNTEVKSSEIDPKKSLYWLTGGDIEWITLNNYKKPWHECEHIFVEEFGERIKSIISKSKTYLDIRNWFIKYLNLPTLYEFALVNNLAI